MNLKALRIAASRASLEWWLCHPLAFGLTTATPVQRALCQVLDGGISAELAAHPEVIEAFGGRVPTEPTAQLLLLGGVRGAKSLLAAAAAVRCTQRVSLAKIRESDTARVSICSLDIDKARVVLDDHLKGALQRSPFLRSIYLRATDDGLLFRHPTGQPVEVSVVAGRRAGGHLVSRWSAGVIFDEAPRMTGASDGVVNLDHARTAVQSRLLDGSMLLMPGSPWAPFGPAYQLYQDHYGSPSKTIVVAKCRGPVMNPVWWTPENCEAVRLSNPDSHQTDVECNFLTPVSSLLSESTLAGLCTIPDEDQPYDPLQSYVGFMDPGTRGNAWTLVISTRRGDMRSTVAHREWRGSSKAPLSPKMVLQECAQVLRQYGLTYCYQDQYYIDANQDLAKAEGLTLVQHDMQQAERARVYLQFRAECISGNIRLHNNVQMRADLQRVERHVTQSGINIQLPHTADGRHCDYAPAVVPCLVMSLRDRRPEEAKEDEESRRMREAHLKRLSPKKW